jgi:hypothetical protein
MVKSFVEYQIEYRQRQKNLGRSAWHIYLPDEMPRPPQKLMIELDSRMANHQSRNASHRGTRKITCGKESKTSDKVIALFSFWRKIAP